MYLHLIRKLFRYDIQNRIGVDKYHPVLLLTFLYDSKSYFYHMTLQNTDLCIKLFLFDRYLLFFH